MDSEIGAIIDLVYPHVGHNENITDNIAIGIEANAVAYQRYQALCDTYGKDTVNKRLGKLVKTKFNLPNTGTPVKSNSNIIGSFTPH